MERVTVGQTVSVSLNIRLGLSVKHLIDEYKSSNVIENIVSSFDPHERFIIAESKKYLGVYLHFDTRPQDVLKAYFFGVSYLQDRNQIKEKYWDIQGKWQEFLNLAQKEGESQRNSKPKTNVVKFLDAIFLTFPLSISQGWLVNQHLLLVDEYRLDWKV